MSSTRHAAPGSPLRQEKYSSSPAITEYGLKPACVAKRCAVIEDAKEREVIWYLQARSHQRGGLATVANEMIEIFAERIAPPSLANFKGRRDKPLSAELVRQVRAETDAPERFLMHGEFTERDAQYLEMLESPVMGEFGMEQRDRSRDTAATSIRQKSAARALSYTAGDFIDHAQRAAAGLLEKHLLELCLNPATAFADPWYFRDLFAALCDMLVIWAEQKSEICVDGHPEHIAQTAIGEAMRETLDYAAATGSLVLLNAPEGSGMTFHARAVCERWPGLARYVHVPAGNDRRSFFRAIADALHGPAGSSWKALELQERVEEIVRTSGLVLFFDDALQLLPDREREATPDRIDWIVTALAECGLPAVLTTEPSFDVRMEGIHQRSRWSTQGFNHRAVRREIPQTLSKADVFATAAAMLPAAGKEELDNVVTHTLTAGRRSLHFLRTVRRSAAFVAKREGDTEITAAHIRKALNGFALPHATELSKATERAEKAAAPRFRRNRKTFPPALREQPAPTSRPNSESPASDTRRSNSGVPLLPDTAMAVE